jgi:hypothetical protein
MKPTGRPARWRSMLVPQRGDLRFDLREPRRFGAGPSALTRFRAGPMTMIDQNQAISGREAVGSQRQGAWPHITSNP